MVERLDWQRVFRYVRLGAVGLLLALWLGSFFVGCGWGWLGLLHRQSPGGEHLVLTLAITGLPVAAMTYLLWPGVSRGRRLVWRGLALLLVAEVVLRFVPSTPSDEVVLLPGETSFTARLHEPHHYSLYQPRPNIHTPDGLIHNRFGFRDARPLNPDSSAIRLVFLGGPTVYGAVTRDNRQLFTSQLEARLNAVYRKELGGRHFEVINAGMTNATSAETLLRLIFSASEVQPALVAVQLGVSDSWPRTASDDYFGDFRQMRKRYSHGRVCDLRLTLIDSVTRALIYRSALLDRLFGNLIPGEPLLQMTNHNNSGQLRRLKTNPPIFYERNLRYMVALIRTMGAEPLLVGDPLPVDPKWVSPYQGIVREHNAVMARIGLDEKTPFLDLATALPLTDDIRLRDKYLNAEGQRRQAELLLGFLRQEHVIERLLKR